MHVIKGYVAVNDDVGIEPMRQLAEVWTERQRNARNRVVMKKEIVSCNKKDYNI